MIKYVFVYIKWVNFLWIYVKVLLFVFLKSKIYICGSYYHKTSVNLNIGRDKFFLPIVLFNSSMINFFKIPVDCEEKKKKHLIYEIFSDIFQMSIWILKLNDLYSTMCFWTKVIFIRNIHLKINISKKTKVIIVIHFYRN